MEQHEGVMKRSFIALVEVEQDESDLEIGGWVTVDAIAEDDLYPPLELQLLPYQSIFPRRESGLLTLRSPLKQTLSRFPNLNSDGAIWARVLVSNEISPSFVTAEVILFGDAEDRPVVSLLEASRLKPKEEASLDIYAMLRNEPISGAGLIGGLLSLPFKRQPLHRVAVAVYDIGQGSCNAIVDENQHPRLFFDLGWAPNFHAKSRPAKMPNFFACDDIIGAPVVLSHWDMDHWSYAIDSSRFNPSNLTTKHVWRKDALSRLWVARKPLTVQHKIGFLTQAFYAALAHTQLLPGVPAIQLWPEKAKRIKFTAGWLEACIPSDPTSSDRNNSGLAMFVKPSSQKAAILLTGDADFPCIPSVTGKKIALAGMVAPHHGARVTANAAPKPEVGTPCRLVMSVGHDNTYGHPKQEAIDLYAQLGWVASRTQDRSECSYHHPTSHVHGSTLLKFATNSHNPKCGCKSVPNGKLCLLPFTLAPVKPVAGQKPVKAKPNEAMAPNATAN